MLVIEVQLPQHEERKKIEWNKNGDPTFAELKDRIQQCGVPDDWCVEVLRGSNFVSPDLQTHIQGPKITVRASPILGQISSPSKFHYFEFAVQNPRNFTKIRFSLTPEGPRIHRKFSRSYC